MHCVSARVFLALAMLAVGATTTLADDDEPSLFSSQWMEGLVIRGQSPPPPQLKVAQTLVPQADPYYSTNPAYGPGGAVMLPPMDPYSTCPPPPCPPPRQCRLGVFAEFLYLMPRQVDVPFAVPQDGIVLPGSVPTAAVGVADPGFQPGFRAGGYIGLGPEGRLIATYTLYTSTTDTTIDAAAPSVINPLVLFPGTFNAGFTAQQASASYDINYQFIDIDYQAVSECCCQYWWGYSGGARYARLEQEFSATFPFDPPDGATSVSTVANFEGIGPRAGLEGERVIFPNLGLRAYGKTSASFLVGNFRSTYQQVNQFNGVEANTGLKQDRIVPILDFELGLAWVSPRDHVRISAGYLVSAWFNSVTTPGWIDSVQDGSYQPGADTITFDGLAARGEVRF